MAECKECQRFYGRGLRIGLMIGIVGVIIQTVICLKVLARGA